MTLKTHKPAKVAVDEQTRMANGSLQYLVEGRDDKTRGGDGSAPVTRGNTLSFMICGEDGFKSIAKDLWEAKESADIICWGFDPAMELDRSGDAWPRGLRYGDLLTLIATRDNPVTVRLLVWYDPNPLVWKNANNIPGYTDHSDYYPNKWALSSPYASKERQDYCVEWWAKNLPGGRNNAGENKNLHVVFRSVAKKDVVALLAKPIPVMKDGKVANEGEDERKGIYEENGLEMAGSHHQKPILIDYDYEQGSKAIGYVMGLNSVTDYWDRTAHEVDDPLRELWASDTIKDETGHQTDAEGKANSSVYKHAKPYQDYACRVQGPALAQLKYNFENGWAAALGQSLPFDKPPAPPAKIKTVAGNPAHLVQILRTQAHEGEKSIKEVYFQAASNAYNYIYIENQYFFYPEFARHLKETRAKHRSDWAAKSGKPVSEMPNLYLFIVIPHPERDQMIPRTYDMLTELGQGQKVGDIEPMAEQRALADKGKLDQPYPNSHKGHKGGQVLDRPSLQDLEQTLGLQVSVARLRTSGPDANGNMAYREVYIHSKLMIVDDAFITVGSANLNQRSMSADSEINIAATGQLYATDLRKRIFSLHSVDNSWSGDPKDLPITFRKWNDLMISNNDQRQSGKPMKGFLLQFEDHRSSTSLYASIDGPSSNASDT